MQMLCVMKYKGCLRTFIIAHIQNLIPVRQMLSVTCLEKLMSLLKYKSTGIGQQNAHKSTMENGTAIYVDMNRKYLKIRRFARTVE